MTDEVWKPIKGFEGLYEVSSLGRIKSLERKVLRLSYEVIVHERILIPRRCSSGRYRKVGLCYEGKVTCRMIHHLVLEAFLGPCPEGMETRHYNNDGVDNRLENLVWGTKKENQADRIIHGTTNRGERCATVKLTEKDVKFIRNWKGKLKDVAADFGISISNACMIRKGNSWKNI